MTQGYKYKEHKINSKKGKETKIWAFYSHRRNNIMEWYSQRDFK